MTAYIGYDNAFYQSGVTITDNWTQPDGFPLENCYDYKLHTATKSGTTGALLIDVDAGSGNTITADYLAFAGHNIDTTATSVRLQHSDDDVTYTTLMTLSNAGTNFGYSATAETHRYWRVRVVGATADTIISHISFGQALQCMPIGKGYEPTTHQQYEADNRTNRHGNYTGNTVRKAPQDLRIKQQGIDPADFRTDWVPFLQHAETKPFFFVAEYEDYPGEAVFCWADRNQKASYQSICKMGVDLRVKALRE